MEETVCDTSSSLLHHANNENCINSAELLGASGMTIIIHQGQRYMLRQTKAGKLILTK
ncbi:hemin uptake protein HemP [Rouxiella sp. Mn2063]|uniref:hemin uptake protein HemP n=1 Tax=Rouxiella sp. Mn2063 TaxID=3395262 RepID=UPI003BC22CDD